MRPTGATAGWGVSPWTRTAIWLWATACRTGAFPGIRYAGRLANDSAGTLPQGEVTLVGGGGAQTHPSARWGDYSSMNVDPQDDCTFWYTTEYYPSTSAAGWRTRIGSFKFPSCGVTRFEYTAKVMCGPQRDPKDMRLARGFYATAVNIHNPHRAAATLTKKLALTFPPEEQRPGKVLPIGRDILGYDEALEVDCMDIQRAVFPDGFPAPYIKGFVVIQSKESLDVTAVYTSASLNEQGEATTHSSLDVEQIRERQVGPRELPDLLPVDKASAGSGPFCILKDVGGWRLVVTIKNQGSGSAGSSVTRVDFLRGERPSPATRSRPALLLAARKPSWSSSSRRDGSPARVLSHSGSQQTAPGRFRKRTRQTTLATGRVYVSGEMELMSGWPCKIPTL